MLSAAHEKGMFRERRFSDQLSAFSEPVLPERPLAAPAMALIDAVAITLPTGRLAPALPALGGR